MRGEGEFMASMAIVDTLTISFSSNYHRVIFV